MQVVAQEHQEFGVRVESRKGPKKKNPKKCVLQVGKFIFLLVIFLLLLFLHTSNMISRA
jgi:hypothetical protein